MGTYKSLIAGSGIPKVTINYTYTDLVTGCSATVTKIVTTLVLPRPRVNSPTICEGETATLTVDNCAGALDWSRSGIISESRTIKVSPTVSTDYYARCSNGRCDSLVIARVTVVPKVKATIVGPDTLCASRLPFTYTGMPMGGSFIIPSGVPSGAVTANGNLLTVNPGFDITNTYFSYQKTETVAGCTSRSVAEKYITISPPIKPTVSAPVTICDGARVDLVITNCPGKIYWSSNGFQTILDETLPNASVRPNVTTEYYVRCITDGGCDTTLTTKVTVEGKQPELTLGDGFCSNTNNTGTIAVFAAAGATVTNSIGTFQDNYVFGVPDYQTLTVNATLNGYTAERSVTFNCAPNPPAPKCYLNRIDTISATAATCAGSFLNNDAAIIINGTYADRYTYATTSKALLPYDKAFQVRDSRVVIPNLPNPASPAGQLYYVRIYNRSDSCSRDTTIVVPYRDCLAPCVKPDAGHDFFSRSNPYVIKLPEAGPLQKWKAALENPSGILNVATGLVYDVTVSGKYTFVLADEGAGGPCTDTVVVYVGAQTLKSITTYSDTLTLPRYLVNQWQSKTLTNLDGIWSTSPGNPATLTNSGKVSGLIAPGEYKFVMRIPYDRIYPGGAFDTLTLTVIKRASPNDCPPRLCIPVLIKKIKLAVK